MPEDLRATVQTRFPERIARAHERLGRATEDLERFDALKQLAQATVDFLLDVLGAEQASRPRDAADAALARDVERLREKGTDQLGAKSKLVERLLARIGASAHLPALLPPGRAHATTRAAAFVTLWKSVLAAWERSPAVTDALHDGIGPAAEHTTARGGAPADDSLAGFLKALSECRNAWEHRDRIPLGGRVLSADLGPRFLALVVPPMREGLEEVLGFLAADVRTRAIAHVRSVELQSDGRYRVTLDREDGLARPVEMLADQSIPLRAGERWLFHRADRVLVLRLASEAQAIGAEGPAAPAATTRPSRRPIAALAIVIVAGVALVGAAIGVDAFQREAESPLELELLRTTGDPVEPTSEPCLQKSPIVLKLRGRVPENLYLLEIVGAVETKPGRPRVQLWRKEELRGQERGWLEWNWFTESPPSLTVILLVASKDLDARALGEDLQPLAESPTLSSRTHLLWTREGVRSSRSTSDVPEWALRAWKRIAREPLVSLQGRTIPVAPL